MHLMKESSHIPLIPIICGEFFDALSHALAMSKDLVSFETIPADHK